MKVVLGNHTAVHAPRSDQERIRQFFCDIIGATANITSADVDRFQLGDAHFCFVYHEAAPEESHFLKSTYLELKTDDPEGLKRRALAFGVKRLEVPDAHFYFQAPGGQVYRIVGIDEDLSKYEVSTSTRPGITLQEQNA